MFDRDFAHTQNQAFDDDKRKLHEGQPRDVEEPALDGKVTEHAAGLLRSQL